MLFRRRTKLRWWEYARRALWPESGWRRSLRYVWHRLGRLRDSPHGVAAGVASGVAISFTPFMGFHLIGAAGIAMATRGNVLAAWLGTLIGNPWTFPLIWIGIYRLGALLTGLEPSTHAERLSLDLLIHNPVHAIKPIMLPMSVGGVPVAILGWFITYWPLKRALERLHERRRRKLASVRSGKNAGAQAGTTVGQA